ncbi:Mobile element protein [Rubellimicrobium mesophilum DSM 19309]|uniref:Mobile element protein n=1 Tax=Rubellimicrobium mesophilum DSM 19309 TaxID=442562 RepID=A0A017HVI0_9RHOB|nr:Mobile element protein [Rubellimicrobium mesophilum DSM 19309]
MSKPSPARYRTTNWPGYNASLRQRGSLLVWLDREMEWSAPKLGRPGRPQTFSEAAIQFGLSIKVLFGLALRQTIGMVESLLRLAGLDWPVPDFSTLCRRQKTVSIQIPFRRPGGELNLLVDSTGVKMRGEGEWQVRKHGHSRRRQWRKVHLAIDLATGDIRGVEFTSSQTGDSRCCPIFWRRFRAIRPSAPSRRTGPTTPGPATPQLLGEAARRSFQSARAAGPGKTTAPPPRLGTRTCGRHATSAGPSGSD